MYVIIIMTSGSVAKAIGDLLEEIFLVFSVVLREDSSVFLELDIELVE